MFALYSTLLASRQGDVDTEYVVATFDTRELAQTYLESTPDYKNYPHGYSIRPYEVPPHNPAPIKAKTERERRLEEIASLEQQLKALKKSLK